MATAEARAGAAPPARFEIRDGREDDLPAILGIEVASFSTPWREETFRALLLRTDSDLLVADAGGEVAGYAVSWTVIDQAELGNVAVAAARRGAGIGGALVDAVVERVRARGAEECFLEVRESNRAAQHLYRHRGFVVVGRRPRYYAQPVEDALVMRLRIGAFP
jgi:[ribosomal protein S18]-alanine N-acetyltransferase